LFVDVQRQRLLIATGRLREARALLDGYGELGGELGRYLRYRNALARFQSGDEGGTLALARGLLGRRSIAESSVDPIAHATEELVYLQLARHPFSPEQIEVVESIGLVGELYLRMEALAGIALERGRPELAAQIDRWLLDKQPKTAYGRPGWLGRLAVAAAELGDAAAFQAAIGPLFDEAMQPLPKTKRGPAHRSIEWDRQILLMTRDCVNPLVARRGFASLKLLVDELQRYLRAQKKPTYPELTDLYRLASSQLPPSPRAYAEKVGREHQPVWIGQVTLDRPTVVVPQPEQTLPRLRGPVTLLCIPDGRGGCPRWLGPPAKEPRDAR
jgi:hypothetical protein